ncbi:MAG: PucR family transcriptional regulator ligand-binding domain-containing protein [Lachnospira sp.]
MAVTVRRLCRNLKKEYRLNMIAGAEGLGNFVEWVHIIEDIEVADFLNGNELVMTTGIGNINTPENIMKYAKRLYEKHCSCLIINIGPYIKEVPRVLIDFCNENNMPLFTVPWEVRLVNLTRWFCEMLVENAEKERSLTSLVKDYLFKLEERPMLYSDLTRHGFSQHLNYCVITFGLEMEREEKPDAQIMEHLHEMMEWEVNKLPGSSVIFKNDGRYMVITAGMMTKDIERFVVQMQKKHMGDTAKLHIAVSSNKENLTSLPKNFEMANRVYALGIILSEPVLYYDELETYKLLLLVSDKKEMKDYEQKYLGAVLEYDESNNTDYLQFIKLFLENGANVQQLANSMFVHRNTIHYKMNKIKEIAGINLGNLDDLLKLKLSLYIKDIR